MSIRPVDLPPGEQALPENVARFLAEADARIDRFIEGSSDRPIIGFVPSDYARVYPALRTIVEEGLATGRTFCEWGSGFGVVASLAAILGFRSHGIEIEPRLLAEARKLAADFDLPVEFGKGSFVPPGGEEIAEQVEDHAYLSLGGQCGHEDLGLEPDECDVIFAFPWPGEERIILELFEEFAAVGALLVTYHGREDVYVWRQTADQA